MGISCQREEQAEGRNQRGKELDSHMKIGLVLESRTAVAKPRLLFPRLHVEF